MLLPLPRTLSAASRTPAIVAIAFVLSITLGACASRPPSPAPRAASVPPRVEAPRIEEPPPARTEPYRAEPPPMPGTVDDQAVIMTAPPVSVAPLPPDTPLAPARPSMAAGAAIALVLPTQSATFGPAASAVEAGFRAAAELSSTRITVFAHGDGDVLAAFAKADADRVRVVAGPLLRDDLKALATSTAPLPWTVALNQLEDDAVLPDRVYTLALSVESEARQIARTLQLQGVRDVAVIASESPLQRRFAASFVGEWILLGGGPPASYAIVRTPETLTTLRQELVRVAPSAVVLAGNASDAAVVRPYLPRAPVYASSQIYERGELPIMSDLDDIHFVEVPWIAEPDAPRFAGIPRREFATIALERLYALGLDALQVTAAFERGPPSRLDMEGATGYLRLENRRISREGDLVHLENGRIVLDTVR